MIHPKIRATNMELTDAIRNYVEQRLLAVDKMLPDDADEPALCEVEIERTTNHHQSGDIYRAEINLTFKGKLHRVEATETDLYAAIDEVKDDLVEDLRRTKGKRLTLIRKGGAKIKNMLRRFKW